MQRITFNDQVSLLQINAYLHDAEFVKEDIEYSGERNIFSLKALEFEYKSKGIFQKRTEKVLKRLKLVLFDAKEYSICDKDKKGYESVGRDEINDIKLFNNKLTITTTFSTIIVEIDRINGYLEWDEPETK